MDKELTSTFKALLESYGTAVGDQALASCNDNTKCETRIQIGVFFDGTKNSRDEDRSSYSDTNVVRLFYAYPEVRTDGIHKIYVPGVGTRFPEIGETKELEFGSAFGTGCHSRILYALLETLNIISRNVSGKPLFTGPQVKGLCTTKPSRADIHAISAFGLARPLSDDQLTSELAEGFFQQQIKELSAVIQRSGVKIKECTLDVFGFSRGAAQARVYCSRVSAFGSKKSLAGISVAIRFMGIFDTVASAGATEGIGNAIVNSTGGHVDWAQAENLRIKPDVRLCVHMVAMHEIRKNFPLDEVSIDGVLPPNCLEIAYPGAHSDVGGGYSPGQLGIAVCEEVEEGDMHKLSQIPLGHMFELAKGAGVPLANNAETRLKVHPDVENQYRRFIEISGPGPKKLSDWMAPYLAWRWQVRKQYTELAQVKNATASDRVLLLGGNETFIGDANHIYLRGDEEKASKFVSLARLKKKFDLKNAEYRQDEISALDPEAPHVLACAKAHPPVPPALAEFFDLYVHDSLAGFRKDLKEPTGYWRYRRSFRGSEAPELTQSDEPTKMPRTA